MLHFAYGSNMSRALHRPMRVAANAAKKIRLAAVVGVVLKKRAADQGMGG